MDYDEDNFSLKENEITVERNKKKKSKKRINNRLDQTENNLYSLELVFLSIFFIFVLIFIIYCITSYIFKVNKTFPTEEDNNNKRIQNYLVKRSEMNELERGDLYCELCYDGLLFRKRELKMVEYPKISIIIITQNNEREILKLLRSIQNQDFNDIEIIFIDNVSKDKTVQVIEKYQNEDKRIILVKNIKPCERLMNIKSGLVHAKGDYILVSDPNDIYSDKIFEIAYSTAKKNNYDIVGFNIFTIDYGIHDLGFNHKSNIPIRQPELSSIMYYGKGKLTQSDRIIWNKLIKRDTFIDTMNSIKDEYLKNPLNVYGDSIILFKLFRTAKSFYFINNFGYICFGYHGSLNRNLNANIEGLFKDYVLYLKFIFENTYNIKKDKNMAFEAFRNQYYNFFKSKKPQEKIKKDYEFYIKVFDMYLKSKLIPKNDIPLIESVNNVIKEKFNKTIKQIPKKLKVNKKPVSVSAPKKVQKKK
jgi:glycosyltransferase involved in cell wall biosynthesis